MFKKTLDLLNVKTSNDARDLRRAHARRENGRCVGMIDGKIYPIENWSRGGVLIAGEGKTFAMDQEIGITLKFKLNDKIIDMAHSGKVIRKSGNSFAVQFAPLNKDVHNKFKKVIDFLVTGEFASSQPA